MVVSKLAVTMVVRLLSGRAHKLLHTARQIAQLCNPNMSLMGIAAERSEDVSHVVLVAFVP